MTTERPLLLEIVIPNYPDKIIISKARRPIYYVKKTSGIKGKTDIPKSFLNEIKFHFDDKGVLINNKTGLPQLANAQTAGKPRFWTINFQDIWNQNVTKQSRNSKVEKLKEILRPFIQELPTINVYPLKLEIFIYDLECPVDISNKGVIYTKVIEDLLVNTNKDKSNNRHIIIDDSINYINDSGRTKFIKIADDKDKRMEIRIFKSDNLNY